jgi:hypothetical protein
MVPKGGRSQIFSCSFPTLCTCSLHLLFFSDALACHSTPYKVHFANEFLWYIEPGPNTRSFGISRTHHSWQMVINKLIYRYQTTSCWWNSLEIIKIAGMAGASLRDNMGSSNKSPPTYGKCRLQMGFSENRVSRKITMRSFGSWLIIMFPVKKLPIRFFTKKSPSLILWARP